MASNGQTTEVSRDTEKDGEEGADADAKGDDNNTPDDTKPTGDLTSDSSAPTPNSLLA